MPFINILMIVEGVLFILFCTILYDYFSKRMVFYGVHIAKNESEERIGRCKIKTNVPNISLLTARDYYIKFKFFAIPHDFMTLNDVRKMIGKNGYSTAMPAEIVDLMRSRIDQHDIEKIFCASFVSLLSFSFDDDDISIYIASPQHLMRNDIIVAAKYK